MKKLILSTLMGLIFSATAAKAVVLTYSYEGMPYICQDPSGCLSVGFGETWGSTGLTGFFLVDLDLFPAKTTRSVKISAIEKPVYGPDLDNVVIWTFTITKPNFKWTQTTTTRLFSFPTASADTGFGVAVLGTHSIFTQSQAGSKFEMEFDEKGQVIAWDWICFCGGSAYDPYSRGNIATMQGYDGHGDLGGRSNGPGTWSGAALVPLPASLPVLGFALATLFSLRRRMAAKVISQ